MALDFLFPYSRFYSNTEFTVIVLFILSSTVFLTLACRNLSHIRTIAVGCLYLQTTFGGKSTDTMHLYL